MGSYVVRILKSELWNFKNVKHGVVKYMNYGCVQKYGEIQKKDIVGIYGQNGGVFRHFKAYFTWDRDIL